MKGLLVTAFLLGAGCVDINRKLAGTEMDGSLVVNAAGVWQQLSFTNVQWPSDTVMTANGQTMRKQDLGGGDFAYVLDAPPASDAVSFRAQSSNEQVSCTFLSVGADRGFVPVDPADGVLQSSGQMTLRSTPASDVLEMITPSATFVYSNAASPIPLIAAVSGVGLDVLPSPSVSQPTAASELAGNLVIQGIFVSLGDGGDCEDARWWIRVRAHEFHTPVTFVW